MIAKRYMVFAWDEYCQSPFFKYIDGVFESTYINSFDEYKEAMDCARENGLDSGLSMVIDRTPLNLT